MGLQGPALSAAGLGIVVDTPGTPEQPPLSPGIHLRWGTDAGLAFPWYGFYLYRRSSVPGVPERFDAASLGTVPGPLAVTVLDTRQGTWRSDVNLVLTDSEPPAGSLELDLAARDYLRFDRAGDVRMRRAEVTVAFRRQPDEPEPVTDGVDFRGRKPGSGPNPRTERGVEFLVIGEHGKPPRRSHIRVERVGPQAVSGLDGEHGLDITLPVPSTHVELTLTRWGAEDRHDHRDAHHEPGHHEPGHHDCPEHGHVGVAITAVELDGTSTTVNLKPARHPVLDTTSLFGNAITRIEVRPSPHHQQSMLLNAIGYGTARLSRLDLAAWDRDVPVAHASLVGYAGLTVTGSVGFDGFTAVRLGSASACLVDLSWVPLDQDTTTGWQPAPGYSGPVRLPVSHPDYPCTPGAAPSLTASRDLARGRIHYGDPDDYTAVPQAGPGTGTVTVTTGSPVVTGSGTAWDADTAAVLLSVPDHDDAYGIVRVVDPGTLLLTRPYTGPSRTGVPYTLADDPFAHLHDLLMTLVTGGPDGGPMAARALPAPVDRTGTVSAVHGSPDVTGTGTSWDGWQSGLTFQVDGDPSGYTIVAVTGAGGLTLDRPYAGVGGTGLGYAITATFQAAGGAAGAPDTTSLRPLDLVLLAAADPAVAQMLGLYALDTEAETDQDYDYLLVADRGGVGGLDQAALLAAILANGFDGVDAFIVHRQRPGTPDPLAPPEALRLYALPGVNRADGPEGQDTSNAVGLRWDPRRTDQDVLVPGGPIGYHVWRAGLGDGTDPVASDTYEILTRGRPVVPSEQPMAATAPDRPPLPLYAVDSGLVEGWYAYRVSGVDIFGRHSSLGAPGSWWQWAPVPTPRPWYYQDPPGDRQLHDAAIRLLVKTTPPAPPGVQAWALDPADPLVVRDPAHQSWWSALTAAPWYQTLSEQQQRDLIGLRVRWRWTERERVQAPAAREFRVYLQPGRLNALLGRVVGTQPGGPGETLAVTDIDHAAPAGAFAGAVLRVGAEAFPIVDSGAEAPLVLRVSHVGIDQEVVPAAPAPCSVVVPRAVTTGTVELTRDSDTVVGRRTGWNATLTGAAFRVPPAPDRYVVVEVIAPDRLRLDRPYRGDGASGRRYAIDHPLWTEFNRPGGWQQRWYAVDAAEHWSPVPEEPGTRQYEIFLPDPAGAIHDGLPLHPGTADPIGYAQIGLSAADRQPHTPDDPQWTGGNWGDRPGNEGPVGAPATVFRVWREPPPVPVMPAYTVDHFLATGADQAGESVHSLRWSAAPGLRVHVFRTLDEGVFRADWPQRPRPELGPGPGDPFPDESREPRWDAQLREQVAAELNALNGFDHDEAGTAQAWLAYTALSDDALRVLSGLPGNEVAFAQATTVPLDPDDPVHADRPGPDDPAGYQPDPALCVFRVVLDGRAPGRHVFRLKQVDTAGNTSPPGPATPPLHVPDVRPPVPPRLLRAVAAPGEDGDRAIDVEWTQAGSRAGVGWEVSVRPAGTGEWQPAGTVAAGTPPDPSGRYGFRHTGRVPGLAYEYIVVAVRDTQVAPPGTSLTLHSVPSEPRTGTAVSRAALVAPAGVAATSDGPHQVRVTWSNGDAYRALSVWRRPASGRIYRQVSEALPANAAEFLDSAAPTGQWRYQVRAAGVRREARSADAEVTVP